MATYRQVDIRLWHDRKFLSCSDDGRMFWLFLLTTTFAKSIPGVIVAGDGAMAEELGWDTKRLTKALGEVLTKGLRVKREGRLTWLPNALKYQRRGGPKSIAGMGKVWDDIPDCALKLEIWEALRIALKSWGKLFDKHLPKPLAKPLTQAPYQGDHTTEQEQEQETEDIAAPVAQDVSAPLLQFMAEVDQTAPAHNARAAHPRDPARELAEVACREINRLSNSAYRPDSKSVMRLCRALAKARHTPEQVTSVIASRRKWIGDPVMGDRFCPGTILAIANFEKYLDELEAKGAPQPRSDAPRLVAQREEIVHPLMALIRMDEEPDAA